MIGQKLSHFEITAKLGEGGMGEVWRAEDTKLGREVAIKVLPAAFTRDAERLARFEREAQVLASLNHPNVAAIYEVGEVEIEGERSSFLVMELAGGETLAERLGRGAVPVEEALPIALQIIAGLEAAHERGIVHRDLKPANVMVTGRGEVKILDFGLAKAWEGPSEASPSLTRSPTLTAQMTQAGIILGTAAYMSPEQARGEEADQRADIWAFGVILWEMLTGRRLFSEPTVSDTLAAVLRADLDFDTLPSGTPWRAREVLRLCLERNPKNRLHAIADARLGLSSEPPVPVTAASAPDTRVRLPIAVLVSLATISLAIAALFAWLWAHDRTEPERLARFSIVPAEGTTFGVGEGLALSPDGSKLVFPAVDASGDSRLYLRSLEELEPTVLGGSEGASHPFWSPDGSQIAFFVDDRLKRMAASGGPAQTICDAPGSRGGAWGPDDVIVFSSGDSGGRGSLYTVAAAGGAPTRITELDEARKEFSHRWPVFLPDGKHVLFVAQTGEGIMEDDASTIEVLDLASGERTRVLSANSSMHYAEGHILYWRQGSVLAQAFDPETFEIRGAPRVVLERVGYTAAEYATFSASAEGTLVLQEGAVQASVLTWFDAEGNELERLGEPSTTIVGPRISHDGSRVAYELDDDIWILDLSRGTQTRLTFTKSQYAPIWSPDDEWVAFASVRSPAGIYRKLASGLGDEELLVRFEEDSIRSGHPVGWTPDGGGILAMLYRGETEGDILRYDIADGTVAALVATPFFEREAALSPDGNWLAVSSNESGDWEVYAHRLTGQGGRWQLSAGGGEEPIWSRDGRHVYYRSTRAAGALMRVAVETGETFRAETPIEVMRVPSRPGGAGYDVTADETRFLWNALTGGEEREKPLTIVQNWTRLLGPTP